MRRKASTMVRPKRGKLVNASGAGPTEPPATLGFSVSANSKTVQESPPNIMHLTLPLHGRSLLQFLNEDRTRQRFCDVSVSVGGKVYGAHRVVLAHGSSYFHAELSKNSAATTHVTLDHVEDSVFQYLLDFLYTAECVVVDSDLPALVEAARFLDMMDILKLICEEGVGVVHAQTELRGAPQPEGTPRDLTRPDTDVQSSEDKHGLFNHQFSIDTSLQDSVAETTEGHQGTTGQRRTVTRRSARSRRTPTKYKRDEVKCSPRKEAEDSVEEAGDTFVENQTLKLDVNEISKADDLMDEDGEEDERMDMNAGDAAQQKAAEVRGTDGGGGEESPPGGRTDQQSEEAAGSSNKSRVYPEGLAPIVIKAAGKKMLKCPKCDKTFDRAGEA